MALTHKARHGMFVAGMVMLVLAGTGIIADVFNSKLRLVAVPENGILYAAMITGVIGGVLFFCGHEKPEGRTPPEHIS